MYQYRVDFEPVIDNQKLAKGLIFSQKEHFGECVFDGTVLFATRKLPSDVCIFYLVVCFQSVCFNMM